ncbi:MAG: PAS domain S-box protein [Ktedonobacteraceae bacterium]|nr:PAS domain S-box protein [Ktedonobacteraceae bacterium]
MGQNTAAARNIMLTNKKKPRRKPSSRSRHRQASQSHRALPDPSQAVQELKSQVKQVTSFLELITDGFFHVDEQWHLTFVNQQAEQIVGQPREELLGQEVWTLFPDLVGTPFEKQARLAMKSQQPFRFEAQYPSSHRWFSVQFHPANGGLLVYYNEITEYKCIELALRASEARFRRLLVDANIVGLMITDEEGRFREANDAFLRMIGYTRADLEAGLINWRELTPQEYQARDQEAIEELLATEACKPYEKEFFTSSGSRVPILMAGARFVDTASRSVIALIVDMTAQKEVEQQRETFLSIVGHELRTPLTAISGSIQLAQRRLRHFQGTSSDLSADVQTILGKLDALLEQSLRQTHVQDRLINDLLDASRLAVDKLELALQPSDLITIVRETVEDLRFTSSERTIDFLPPAQPALPVLADPERVAQVVANYITNALKYSSPSEPVTVEMTVESENVYVWVHDRGEGLSSQAQQHIWDRYYRAPNARDQQGHGTNLGLGLYICQVLIKRHSGQVGVKSTSGEGSSFWFSLPLLNPDVSHK